LSVAPGQFALRRRVRRVGAVVILVAWGAGVAALARREFYQGRPQRLAEAALRLSPSATYFAVERGDTAIGFMSTTIDTLTDGIDVTEYFVADLPARGAEQRMSRRSVVKLSRGLSLRSFDTEIESRSAPLHTGGRAEGDSAIVFARFSGTQSADSQRVRVRSPAMLPAMVPIVIALGEGPKVGRKYSLPTFDPETVGSSDAGFTIDAESLFTLVDSARFDEGKGEWVAALTDTVRAWRVSAPDATGWHTGWIDAQGRMVQSVRPGGITVRRTAYELAFENWRIARDRATAANAGEGDILERTLLAAGARFRRSTLRSMSVRLTSPNLKRDALDGGRQQLRGDTLTVVREKDATLGAGAPSLAELRTREMRRRFRSELAEEPLLQTHNSEIIARAARIVGDERDTRLVAQDLGAWVFDSLARKVTSGRPSALAVLRSRKGDCNEHAQLYVALTRALGIPARVATGLLYADGKFYYHAWAEVWLGEWVAVDPTYGQFPADAAHLRFAVGGGAREAELVQLMGNLKIKVLEAK
jgi:hypothetical protein